MEACRDEFRDEYVMVQADVDDTRTRSVQPVELPAEDDGTLLLTVLQSQFEGATGLKYRNPNTGLWRGVRISKGVLHPPSLSAGWGSRAYIVVCPKKFDGSLNGSDHQNHEDEVPAPTINGHHKPVKLGKRIREKSSEEEVEERGDEEGGCARGLDGEKYNLEKSSLDSLAAIMAEDLIVLGLSYSVTQKEFKDYFSQFGVLAHAELKVDPHTNKSRGFGFIRYKDPHVHWSVFTLTHTINGRRCELKRPRKTPSCLPCKFFVGCLPSDPDATTEELRNYFLKYGPLADIYIPRPFRGFGFITFMDGDDGQKMMGFHHSLRGSSLNITVAEPRAPRALPSHLHGYDYTGATSFSVDSRAGSGSEVYAGFISRHSGYHSGREYNSLVPEYRSVVGGAGSF